MYYLPCIKLVVVFIQDRRPPKNILQNNRFHLDSEKTATEMPTLTQCDCATVYKIAVFPCT